VRLAGPSGITQAVNDALGAMTSLRDTADDGIAAVKSNFSPGIADIWAEELRKLRTAIEDFISRASVILEGEEAT
jgi:hypothetical protein